jgi:pimeloyl-ACP methyl ester carboxylesterase
MSQVPLQRSMVQVNGVDFLVRDTATTLPPMLCLHGRWGSGETWSDLIARYRDRYRIIAPDQRGHGLSGKPRARYAPEDMAEDALRDLRQRFPRATNVRYFQESLTGRVEGYDFLFSRWAMSALETYLHGWLHLLPRIQCPTLLVRGTESWALSREQAERMRPHIKDCTYVEITDSDHMVYVDNPKEFDPAFDAWLEDL